MALLVIEFEVIVIVIVNHLFYNLIMDFIQFINILISVALGHDQSRLVKNFNRGQRGQIVDHSSILL